MAVLSLPFAVALLAIRLVVNRWSVRRHRRIQAAADPLEIDGWSLRAALAVLGITTLVTAFVTETLVGSLDAFARAAHLSEFFVAAVIVTIVGVTPPSTGARSCWPHAASSSWLRRYRSPRARRSPAS